MAGQVLNNRYEVQQQLGKQAGRWTLLARDLADDSLVVLKLLFIDENMERDDLKLFDREVETLKSLSHPSIPRYLGYFEIDLPLDGRALALVQSYIEGKSLNQYVQADHPFAEAEVKHIALSVLETLIYLHNCQPPVLHRDIKPSNLVLNDRRVYLVDFGSVRVFTANEEHTSSTVVGTEGYMPPEQFGGRATIPSDLYSLGATLITLATGLTPFHLPHKGVRIDFEAKAPHLSPALIDWLKWLTEPRLDKRCKSAQEAYAALSNPALLEQRQRN